MARSPVVAIGVAVIMLFGMAAASSEFNRRLAADLPSVGLRATIADDRAGAAACPMLSNNITVDARDRFATVTFTQEFRNAEPNVSVEAHYVFPVMPDMAVTSIVATTPRGEYHGVVKEAAAAKAEYDEALARGDGAYLSHYDEKQSDVLTLHVGNLLPNETVQVRVTMVLLLDLVLGQPVFELPLAFVRPYSNQGSPATAAVQTQPQTAHVPYTWCLEATFRVSGGASIVDVQSESYAAVTTPLEGGAAVRVRLGGNGDEPNRVVQLRVLTAHGGMAASGVQLSAPWNATTADRAVHAWFTPRATEDDAASATQTELVIVLDRSGSMSGDSMEVAKRAVVKCLSLLPADVHFNVVSFGSAFTAMFAEGSRPATAAAVQEAVSAVEGFEADMGGTEIEAPLRYIFDQPLLPNFTRTVFLITDGAVGNEAAVVQLIRDHADANRVFGFGIGHGVSPYIIVEGARAGNGQHYLLSGSGNYLAEAMYDSMVHLRSAMWSVLDVRVEAQHAADGSSRPLYQPLMRRHAGRAADGEVLSVTGILEGDAAASVCPDASSGATVVLRVKQFPSGAEHEVRLRMSCDAEPVGRELIQLAAKQVLTELELDGEASGSASHNKEATIGVSTKYQVLCRATSLIAVERREGVDVPSAKAQRHVPAPDPGSSIEWSRLTSPIHMPAQWNSCSRSGALTFPYSATQPVYSSISTSHVAVRARAAQKEYFFMESTESTARYALWNEEMTEGIGAVYLSALVTTEALRRVQVRQEELAAAVAVVGFRVNGNAVVKVLLQDAEAVNTSASTYLNAEGGVTVSIVAFHTDGTPVDVGTLDLLAAPGHATDVDAWAEVEVVLSFALDSPREVLAVTARIDAIDASNSTVIDLSDL